MLTLAFWILVAAALGGVTMAVLDGATKIMRIGHGLIAALGLLILLIGALGDGGTLTWTAFGILAVGFSAGAILFGVVWRDRAPPRLLIVGHGLINTLGIVALGIVVFG